MSVGVGEGWGEGCEGVENKGVGGGNVRVRGGE